ncbi:inosine/xanthosine triphosphatase [Cesiribacter sp. SM1]|uniref:inosine/xanthosine triphosphatase n=1 Tax=Cesiribacter sp. SM1 TaxID=2861196 RepID=UPI001CD1E3D3|nr:inosine/xanthosine triphosphatase [Cesiribacter sp. SM1]
MPEKITLVVASANPVKVQAALAGFQKMHPGANIITKPISVASDVADQPMSDEETLAGATNRVANAMQEQPDADYWIGIEGGVQPLAGELTAFAWIVVRSKKQTGKARTGTFFLPRAVTELVEQGIELGTADDMVFGSKNSKQAGGAVGLLTGNVVDRKQLYEQAVVLALVSFKWDQLYRE